MWEKQPRLLRQVKHSCKEGSNARLCARKQYLTSWKRSLLGPPRSVWQGLQKHSLYLPSELVAKFSHKTHNKKDKSRMNIRSSYGTGCASRMELVLLSRGPFLSSHLGFKICTLVLAPVPAYSSHRNPFWEDFTTRQDMGPVQFH